MSDEALIEAIARVVGEETICDAGFDVTNASDVAHAILAAIQASGTYVVVEKAKVEEGWRLAYREGMEHGR